MAQKHGGHLALQGVGRWGRPVVKSGHHRSCALAGRAACANAHDCQTTQLLPSPHLAPEADGKGDGLHGVGVAADEEAAKEDAAQVVAVGEGGWVRGDMKWSTAWTGRQAREGITAC